ncbi:lysine-specific demethylase 2B-like [Macrobrachium nipponense]|uniref:lysine-specific demethylase 2B-like n=1 Tax=Macrobrachium nipponense TaxID=159736 RepID=UPI0030C858D2
MDTIAANKENIMADPSESCKLCVVPALRNTVPQCSKVIYPKRPLWEELQARVSKTLVYPIIIVRPLGPNKLEDYCTEESDLPYMNRAIMLRVFSHLSVREKFIVMQVCKAWAKWSIYPALWKTVQINHKKINLMHLMGIVRRQPEALDLSWTRLHHDQLLWLLKRLPQLRKLHLQGQKWEVVEALNSAYCPFLDTLDISHCANLSSTALSRLLSVPVSVHSFYADLATRLCALKELRLAGTYIGDDALHCVARCLPSLTSLDLSSCQNLTDFSVAILSHPETPLSYNLSSLDMRDCNKLTFAVLTYFEFFPSMRKLAICPCLHIPLRLVRGWGRRNGYVVAQDNILERNNKKASTS